MLSSINSKLAMIDTQIEKLQQQLIEQKEVRKQVLSQQKKIFKAIEAVNELRQSLPGELWEEFKNAFAIDEPTASPVVLATVISKLLKPSTN